MEYEISESKRTYHKGNSYRFINIKPNSLSEEEKERLSKEIKDNLDKALKNNLYHIWDVFNLSIGNVIILYTNEDEKIIGIIENKNNILTSFDNVKEMKVKTLRKIENGNIKKCNTEYITIHDKDEDMVYVSKTFDNGLRKLAQVQDDILINFINDPKLTLKIL